MVKVTQRKRFMQLREIVESSLTSTDSVDNDAALRNDLLEFIDGRIEMLDRKSNAPKGMTAEQFANGLIKADMLNRLEEAEGLRAGQIAEIMGISNQKATALLTQLVKDGFAKREKIGKVTKFYAV